MLLSNIDKAIAIYELLSPLRCRQEPEKQGLGRRRPRGLDEGSGLVRAKGVGKRAATIIKLQKYIYLTAESPEEVDSLDRLSSELLLTTSTGMVIGSWLRVGYRVDLITQSMAKFAMLMGRKIVLMKVKLLHLQKVETLK